MGWFALSDRDESWFAPPGGAAGDSLAVRGSLVIETRLPQVRHPMPLVQFTRRGDWPMHFAVQALPGGILAVILDQGGVVMRHVVDCADSGRADILRLTYSWDAPRRQGRLAIERTDRDQVTLLAVPAPRPFRLVDLRDLMAPGDNRYLAPDVLYMALSDAIEPVGPAPTLAPDTPIRTPSGYVPAGSLQTGDLILSTEGTAVPVQHAVARTLPARGSFEPLRLQAPYFGLTRDITVAATQQVVLSGSEVEYLFGRETVQIQAATLTAGMPVQTVRPKRFLPYVQVLLATQDTLDAAGMAAQSLYIGRLRRKPDLLDASILAGFDRTDLPEQGLPAHLPLRGFDAVFLAGHRAA